MLPVIIGGAVFLSGAAVVKWFIQDCQYNAIQAELQAKEKEKEAEELQERWRFEMAAQAQAKAEAKAAAEAEAKAVEERLLASGIHKVDGMTGQEFEQFLSLCYRKLGFKVQMTPASQDFGADLILYKDDTKSVVQAKRYKEPVGIKAVQEVIGAIKHYRGNRGIVITNSSFTENACALARSNDIELIDRRELINLVLSSQRANF